MLASFVIAGILPFDKLDVPDPIAVVSVAAIVAIFAGILPWACRRTRVDRHAARFRYCVPRRSCAARDPTRYRPLVLSAHGLSRGAGGRTLRRATDAGPAKRHLAMADPRASHDGMRHSRVGNETAAARGMGIDLVAVQTP